MIRQDGKQLPNWTLTAPVLVHLAPARRHVLSGHGHAIGHVASAAALLPSKPAPAAIRTPPWLVSKWSAMLVAVQLPTAMSIAL